LTRRIIDRERFDCGEEALNEFLRRYAGKSHELGGVAIVIDAKNERVAGWYASYGAVPLLDAPLSLLLPIATVEAALRSGSEFEMNSYGALTVMCQRWRASTECDDGGSPGKGFE